MFMEAQGYDIDENILYQDNKSTMLLETNGRTSAGKQSRAINVRYFFLTDQIQQENLIVKYCPTDLMIGDSMTKPLQGNKFYQFRKIIMGLDGGWAIQLRKTISLFQKYKKENVISRT